MMVHNSCVDEEISAASQPEFNAASLNELNGLPKSELTEFILYQKAGVGSGKHANIPWLQELPDPITKVTWDNYITMNPVEMEGKYATTFDQEHGLNQANIKVGAEELTLPVYPLPGQAPGTVGVALGYGRGANGENIGKAAFQTQEYGGHVILEDGNPAPIGGNAFVFVGEENGTPLSSRVTKSRSGCSPIP